LAGQETQDVTHDCQSLLKDKTPIVICDGQFFQQLLEAGTHWLERHRTAINSLNVFPVPDGDTGTNMVLTMQSALQELRDSPQQYVGAIAQTISHGALMGARGNSGVILSQLLRGIAKSLDRKEVFGPKEFAAALMEASATAYKAVVKPVEGTILTVARDVADAAHIAAQEVEDLAYVLCQVVEAAKLSVARTPSLLPVLAQAGVVDAGGQGLFILLEGMMRFARGEVFDVPLTAISSHAAGAALGQEYGYEIQFVLQGPSLDLETIRETIMKMGESVLVVGDQKAIKVHVHTPEPGIPISYAVGLGSLSNVVLENLQAQAEQFAASGRSAISRASEHKGSIGVVAVSPGPGLTRVFESLGASAIVPGGQTMNPSTEQLLRAVEGMSVDQVIILPNNGNIQLTAQQVAHLSPKQIRVLGTKTVPQGIGALLAFNYQADLDANANIMEQASKNVQTLEVTTAVRSVQINGLDVEAGQVIGLYNGVLSVCGSDIGNVVTQAFAQAEVEDYEIATVYYGEHLTAEIAQDLVEHLQALYSNLEFELVEGGQPHYHYIISLE